MKLQIHCWQQRPTRSSLPMSPSLTTLTTPATSSPSFFFNDTPTTEIYTLSLHDALPIWLNLMASSGGETGKLTELEDCGVSLHVHGLMDGQWLEHLRFDCFQEEPHYHYVGWRTKTNHVLHIDPVADGDALAWALERIRNRLPQMLEHAGAGDVEVDPRKIEAIMPKVTEAAHRARYHSDKGAIQAAAENRAA